MEELKFAGFVMTYERATILLETIDEIFNQTILPNKLLIVDNSETYETQYKLESLNDPRIEYYRVGYNSGPAGAAAIGLKILSSQGYDWIYWGDDDDPPIFKNSFEVLLKIALSNQNCGCVGANGNYFSKLTSFISRPTNDELEGEGLLSVDTIAGGMTKIVNGNMVLKYNIFPEEKLFFSFEELEFDMKIKKIGYSLFVDKSFYLQHRHFHNRIVLPPKNLRKKSDNALRREYYAVRNYMHILYKNKFYFANFIFFSYYSLKSIANYKFGLAYGNKTFLNVLRAFKDFIFGNYGKTI
jgi:GT2 family glycosyltransferase